MKTAFINAQIYTGDKNAPWAQALVIDGDKIEYVGQEDETKYAGAAIKDLKGKYIYPGIIDSHIHPGMVSQSSWHIKLPWTDDLGQVQSFIKEYTQAHSKEDAPFLYFEYYPTKLFGSTGPHKKYLDEACDDRPVMCQDFGEHQHWYNSRMLEAMGVTKETEDPMPGLREFVRDEDGQPTGWGKELVHMEEPFASNLCKAIGWEPPIEMTSEAMIPFFEFLTNAGITAIAEGILEGEAQMKSMYELDIAGKLHTYYDGCVRYYTLEDLPEKIQFLREMQKYNTKHIKLNTMKLFLDGTNESGNSASLHPHENDPTGTNYGEIAMESDELTECFLLCNKEGLDMHIHMVGDRAFRVGCDAVEKAKAKAKKQGVEWVCQPIFAHCEIVDPSDMGRPAQLGITVNWSCHWSGGYFGEEAMTFFTEEKWKKMYQFNPIIRSGALVTFSSDVVTFYELHRANPFFSMQVAATRVDPEFPLDPKKYPGSVRPPESAKLEVPVLLRGYTINGAKQMHWDKIMGSLEEGKIANFNICSSNIEKYPVDRLTELKWDAVIFDGEVVYGDIDSCR
ncbi:MAG: amidohydrolase family protein [Clostridiales bacterium]|nr:amidohydrolase family protein [Clostridiales bacterium]